MVYLDFAATSPLTEAAKSAMLKAMDMPGNASALHTPGHLAMNIIEDAREEIARLTNAEPEEIIFTSGGSESNNTVTNIFAGKKVLVSAIEHPSLLESARMRCDVNTIPVDKSGFISLKDYLVTLKSSGTKDTPPQLVSIMLANNELGTVQSNLRELIDYAHKIGALFHTDATQALGKIPIDVKKLDVDYMTLSSHKIGGPVGIGALFVKKTAPFTPLIIGGHQEKSRRAGTYQTVNIAGFGAAAKYTMENNLIKVYQDKVRPLRNLLAKEILAKVPYSSINTPLEESTDKTKIVSLPHILNCSFEAAEGESIQLYLDAEKDIIVSTGSACASGDGKPSHVLMATRHDAEIAHSSVRFSLGIDTSKDDIDAVMQVLPAIVKRLQGISTLKAGHIKKEDSFYA